MNFVFKNILNLAVGLLVISGQASAAGDGFSPDADASVRTIAISPDGKLVMGGMFTSLGGESHNRIGRLLSNGRPDPQFDPSHTSTFDGDVHVVLIQPDGKILVGGAFTNVGGVSVPYLARLEANGTRDLGFSPPAPNGPVYALAKTADGSIIIGGDFNQVAGADQTNLARIKPNSTIDTGFPGADSVVRALVAYGNGRILVAGQFSRVGNGSHAGIERLRADGAIDSTFVPPVIAGGNGVHAVAIQADGKIILGGNFSTLGGSSRAYLARLLADGVFDSSLNSNANGVVESLALQSDGKLLLGGSFTSIHSQVRNNVARLNADDTLDARFAPIVDGTVRAVTQQMDNNVVMGGDFLNVDATSRAFVARLNLDASLDKDISTSTDGYLGSLSMQADGRFLVGGSFSTIGGFQRNSFARMFGDGSLDATLNQSPFARPLFLWQLHRLEDGGLLTVSDLTTFGDQRRLLRLNAQGAIDASFNAPALNAAIRAVATQSDGSILIGGDFSNLDLGVHIARLNKDGSLDAAFQPEPEPGNNVVVGLTIQNDGKIIVVKDSSPYLMRLLPNGLVDPTFFPMAVPDGRVNFTVPYPDGSLLVCGAFTTPMARIYKLTSGGMLDNSFTANVGGVEIETAALQADGKINITGYRDAALLGIPPATYYFMRLNADGTVDQPPMNGMNITNIAQQADGKILVAGAGGIRAIRQPEAAIQSLHLQNNRVTWLRSGNSPELLAPPVLYYSFNGNAYSAVPAGIMTPISGGWAFDGIAPPVGQPYFIRARAQIGAGSGNSSSGFVESTLKVFVDDVIFSDGFE